MLAIAVKALSLVAIVGIGLGIKRLRWVTRDHFGIFVNLVLKITLPCALITSFNDFTIPLPLLGLVAAGVVVNLVYQVVGFLLGRGSRPAESFGVLNLGTYNMGAFATPYLAGFMGPQAVVYSSLFDVGNAVQAAGFGYAWGMALGRDRRPTPLELLKQVFTSVIFVVYLSLLVMRLAGWRLPEQVITFTGTVGSANTFLAMLMIGIGLELKLARAKYLAAARYLGVRYALAIGFAVAVGFLPLEPMARTVLTMVLFAPIASMTPGFTAEAGGDVELSAFMTSVSILVGIVTMPVVLALLGGSP